jgi:hypothetical protein
MCPCIVLSKGRADKIGRYARAGIVRMQPGHMGNYTPTAVTLPRQLGTAAIASELLALRDQAGCYFQH